MWRKVVESDLTASLSQAEIDAFRKSADFETDPVESQIRQVCAYVRGCIRSGGSHVRMSPDEDTLPESLISPAMDYLRFNLLTRMNLEVNKSRTDAWTAAKELFSQLRRGEYVPESDGQDAPDTEKAASPAHATQTHSNLLD